MAAPSLMVWTGHECPNSKWLRTKTNPFGNQISRVSHLPLNNLVGLCLPEHRMVIQLLARPRVTRKAKRAPSGRLFECFSYFEVN
jgi:hypothetical protein